MKVMLSLPEAAVEKLDRVAKLMGTSRSEAVATMADSQYEQLRIARRSDVLKLVDEAEPHDGRGVEHLAADRRR